MKDSVTRFNFDDAFKALDEIEIPVAEKGIRANRVDLKESMKRVDKFELLFEDFYDVNNADDMNAVSEEREAEVAKAKLARIEKIVDLNAETEDDILPSYVGKTIIQCPQCMTLFYKDAEDIVRDEENPDVVNVNEVCQHCGNESGYDVVGKVAEETEAAPGEELGTDDFSAEVGDGENDIAIDDGSETTEEVPVEEGEVDELSAEADLDSLDLDTEEEPAEDEESVEEEEANESLNTSKLLKKIEDNNELKTEHESEKLTLNEDIEDNLDDKLKAHEEYIKDLRDTISELEKKLASTKNEQIKASIQSRIDATRAELETALPEAVKAEAETEELPDATEAGMEDATDNTSDETEATNDETEETAEESKEVKEALNEAHQLSAGEKIIEENDKEILVKTPKSYALYQVFNKSSVYIGSLLAMDDKSAKAAWQKRDFLESLKSSAKNNNLIEETSEAIPNPSAANINKLFSSAEFKEPVSPEDVKSFFEDVKIADNEKYSVDYRPAFEAIAKELDGKFEFAVNFNVYNEKIVVETTSALQKNDLSKLLDAMTNSKICKENNWEAVYTGLEDNKDTMIKVQFKLAQPEALLAEDTETTDKTTDENNKEATEANPEVKTPAEAEVKVTAEIDKNITEPDINKLTELTEIDDKSFTKVITESLKEVYENVESFTLTDCTIDGHKLILEGLVAFKSTKTRPTTYVFEVQELNNAINLVGTNSDLFESCKINLATTTIKESLYATELTYKYSIQGNLLEGLIRS